MGNMQGRVEEYIFFSRAFIFPTIVRGTRTECFLRKEILFLVFDETSTS